MRDPARRYACSGGVKDQGSRLERFSLQFCASVCTRSVCVSVWIRSVCAQCVDQECLCSVCGSGVFVLVCVIGVVA